MSIVNPLDRVIRLVDSNQVPLSPNEKKVIIDIKNAKVLKRHPLLTLNKVLRYYILSNHNNVECEGIECKIKDIITNNSINLFIAYDLSCPEGSEEKVVRALYKADNPKMAIDEYIVGWVKEYNRLKRKEEVSIISSFFIIKKELQKFISQKALEQTGLMLYPYISVKGEDNLEVLKKTSDNFPIRVRDYDSNIFIKYEVGLEVLENEDKINAILRYTSLPKIHPIIKNEIEKFLIRECTLHELCYDFERTIKPELIRIIDQRIKREGRKISYIKFDLLLSDLIVPETPMIVHETECKIKDSHTVVSVSNRVLMDLDDLGKFRKAKIENLEAWVQLKLDKVVQEVFFERDRIDLLRNLERDKKLIQQYLQNETNGIGYSVKHLAFLPDLEELKLAQGFKVESGFSYRTKDNLKINLEVIINGRIEKFDGIEAHLKDGITAFKKRIAETSESIIEQEVRDRFTAEIYESAFEGDNSLEDLLKAKLIEKLESTFKLVDTRISLLFTETDWTNRVGGLKAAFPKFNVIVERLGSSASVPYTVSYIINGVHPKGFPTFQANAFRSDETIEEIEKVNERISEEFKKIMGTVFIENIRYTDMDTLVVISNKIIPHLKSIIIRSFGLEISDVSIRRLQTNEEKAAAKRSMKNLELGLETEIEIAEETKKAIVDRIKELNEMEKTYLNIGDKKGLKKVRKQKDEILKQSSKYMEDYNQQQNQLDSGKKSKKSKDALSFNDYSGLRLETPTDKENKKDDNS